MLLRAARGDAVTHLLFGGQYSLITIFVVRCVVSGYSGGMVDSHFGESGVWKLGMLLSSRAELSKLARKEPELVERFVEDGEVTRSDVP